jgi:RHS repeat-associated protein
VSSVHDSRGRVTSVANPAWNVTPARTVTTTYAVGGDPTVTAVADVAGTITTKVDLLGRTIGYTDVWGKTTTTAYDRAGNVTGKTFSNLAATGYTIDAAGRLLTQTIGGSTVASATYDTTSGRLTNVSYPTGTGNIGNGTTGTFGIDNLGRPNAMTWNGPGGTLLTSDTVTRSLAGDVKDESIDGVDAYVTGDNFTYDAANRLTAARVSAHTYTYNYAAAGGCGTDTAAGLNSNRTSMVDNTTTTTYCYDNADRLTSTTPTTVAGTLAYDNHGNSTTIFGETHTYDIADRHLTTVKGATTVAYVRDAVGRIIERKVNGTTSARYSHGDGTDSPSITLTAAGVVIEAVYLLPGGAMLTTRTAGNVWSYPNIHGDNIATANNAGAKQGGTSSYDPFGGLVNGAVPDNATGAMDYGWLGQHQRPLEQQSGIAPVIEMGARQYSPLLGRFLEVDPVEGGSCNDYDYVCADPRNGMDIGGTAYLGKNVGKYQANFCKLTGFFRCIKAQGLAPKAEAMADRLKAKYRWSEGQPNAFRHAYWIATTAKRFGSDFAVGLGNAHENDTPGFSRDGRADRHNNQMGARFGAASQRGTDAGISAFLAATISVKGGGFDYFA